MSSSQGGAAAEHPRKLHMREMGFKTDHQGWLRDCLTQKL
jgi:hypothetical protein